MTKLQVYMSVSVAAKRRGDVALGHLQTSRTSQNIYRDADKGETLLAGDPITRNFVQVSFPVLTCSTHWKPSAMLRLIDGVLEGFGEVFPGNADNRHTVPTGCPALNTGRV